MRIKTRLKVHIAVSVTLAFVICLVLSLSLHRINAANDSGKIAGEIMTSILERLALRNDYIRNPVARAKEQWLAKHEQIGVLLKSATEVFRDAQDRKNISGMIEDHEATGRVFSAIVTNRERRDLSSDSAALVRETEERLLSQLNMRVYETVLHGRELLESSRKAGASALRLAGGGIIFILLILITAAVADSRTLGRAVKDRVGRLREGAAFIGEGNLDHRIDLKGDDEFAELSDAFNAMAARLSDSHRDLENQIAERKRTEAELRESGARLDLALQSAQMGVWQWDIIRDRRYFDEQVCRLLGIDASTFTGSAKEFFAVVHPDDRERLQEALHRTIDEDLPYDPEYRVVWPAGTIRHIAARGRLVRNESGQPARINGIVWDITESKRLQEALRESEQRFRLALRNAPVAVAVQDRDLRYIWAYNQRTVRPDEIIGRLDADIFTAEEAARLGGIKRRVLGEDVELREQMWLDRPGGRIFLDLYWEPIHDEAGRVIGVGSATVNLTPMKLAEETAQKYARELQALNAELRASRAAALNLMEDADMARRQVEQAAVSLKAAHDELARQVEQRTRELREKEVLLKEVHHRVKNNLQVISSLVGLQADGSEEETVREVLRDVAYRVRSMALVHEKLYQSSDLARIDFAEYTRSLLGHLWRAHGAAAANVRLTLDLEPVSLPVDIAVPCGLILNELAGNALKHAFQGCAGGEVTVSLRGGVQGQVRLRVRDDGVGLPKGLDWRQARSLGLRLVQMLAGQLDATVEGSGGEGTAFEIAFGVPPRLPFEQGEEKRNPFSR